MGVGGGGVYKILVEILEGLGGGYYNGEEGGLSSFVKFPPWWGYGYFLELYIIYCYADGLSLMTLLIIFLSMSLMMPWN